MSYVDIDECVDENKCNQNCVNLYGGYECTCLSGYKWDSKRAACIVESKSCAVLMFALLSDIH